MTLHNLSGLFRKERLLGLLEAFDFKKFYKFSLFIRDIANIFCASKAGADITKIFVIYASLLSKLSRKLMELS